jgi:hypothetical protein
LLIKFRLAYPTSVPSLDLLFLFYQEKRKSPLGGHEPRQDCARGKKNPYPPSAPSP